MTAAAVDEAKLSKQSKELLRKFTDQATSLRQLEKQLSTLQSKNESLEVESVELVRLKKKEADMRDKLEKLAVGLKEEKDRTLAEVREKEKVEAEARQVLTQRFQGTIAEITTKMEADAEEQGSAVSENKRLRIRLSTLGQQVDLRAQQYEQLLKTRDVELRLTEAKAEHLRDITKGDRYRLEIQQKQLIEESAKEAELKEQLSAITSKFDDLQTTITKSNTLFKDYKGDMDKLTKRIKLLDNEKNEISKRHTAKRKPHDIAQDEVMGQRKKLETLQKAGTSVSGLMEILRQERADFESWKAACPEAFERATAELTEKGELK